MRRIIIIASLCYACGNGNRPIAPIDAADEYYAPTIIYSNEDACRKEVERGRKRIDSFIMLRCSTTDSATWKRYEDSVVAEIERVTIAVGKDNIYKYLNTHPYKKIPCIIGDSVWLFYKETP